MFLQMDFSITLWETQLLRSPRLWLPLRTHNSQLVSKLLLIRPTPQRRNVLPRLPSTQLWLETNTLVFPLLCEFQFIYRMLLSPVVSLLNTIRWHSLALDSIPYSPRCAITTSLTALPLLSRVFFPPLKWWQSRHLLSPRQCSLWVISYFCS